jgi:hypothetical protein
MVAEPFYTVGNVGYFQVMAVEANTSLWRSSISLESVLKSISSKNKRLFAIIEKNNQFYIFSRERSISSGGLANYGLA